MKNVQTQILLTENRQSTPEENLIGNSSVKVDKKFPVKQTKIVSNPINFDPHRHVYPDLRFTCPSCSSFDVGIQWKEESSRLEGFCLDCKTSWVGKMRYE